MINLEEIKTLITKKTKGLLLLIIANTMNMLSNLVYASPIYFLSKVAAFLFYIISINYYWENKIKIKTKETVKVFIFIFVVVNVVDILFKDAQHLLYLALLITFSYLHTVIPKIYVSNSIKQATNIKGIKEIFSLTLLMFLITKNEITLIHLTTIPLINAILTYLTIHFSLTSILRSEGTE